MSKIYLCSAILVAYCSTSCQLSSNIDIQNYYLPLSELKDGLVYEYQSINGEFPPYYWYFRTIEQGNSTFLTGMNYNYRFMPQQFIRETKVSNGMLLEEAYIYEMDTSEKQIKVPLDIVAGNVFPFQVQDSLGIFLYNVNWQSALDGIQTTIIRNRQYKGKTTFEFKGKEYPAITFSVKELIEDEREGVLKLELTGKEIYVKGIGLVYTEKQMLNGDFQQVYQLKDRYSMQVLESKFKESGVAE